MKKNAFLEIIELEDGDFILQRSDSDDDPLATIAFSDEAKELLKEHSTTVAKAMFGAGIQTVGAISQYLTEDQDQQPRVIH